MADQTEADDPDRELTVKHEKSVVQRESLTIKSKRGTGTNDRDEVRTFVEREAELDVPGDDMSVFPTLIGETQRAKEVSRVAEAMAQLRETNNDNDE